MSVTSMRDEVAAGPPLPFGRRIELPGRGITFVRDVPGPTPDAPTCSCSTAGSPAPA